VGLSDTFRYRLKHDHSRLHDSVPTLLFSWMSCSGGILDHAPYGAAHALRLAGHRRLPNLLSAPTVILAQSSHPAWDLPRPAVGRLYRETVALLLPVGSKDKSAQPLGNGRPTCVTCSPRVGGLPLSARPIDYRYDMVDY
jgi:hypothetical protein